MVTPCGFNEGVASVNSAIVGSDSKDKSGGFGFALSKIYVFLLIRMEVNERLI